jgi:lipopolysaccharide/colanic/teichoic acid biosynthesis glycosyltransferase
MPSARRETAILLIGDVLLLILSLWLALVLRNTAIPTASYFKEHLQGFVFVYAASLLVFYISGLYERQTRLVKRILLVRVVGAQFASTILAAILFFSLPFEVTPKTVLALYLVISVILISAWRFFIVPVLSVSHREKAVMIGEGAAVEEVLAAVAKNRIYYFEFIEHLVPSMIPDGGLAKGLASAMAKGARLVVVDTRDARIRAQLPALYDAMLAGEVFSEFSTFYEGLFDRVPFAHIDHAWLLECLPRHAMPYALAKRGIDIIGSLLGIILSSPFVLAAVIAIHLGGGGHAFIRHERIGRGNRIFHIVKLRTMLINDHGDPELQKKNHVTGVGKFLRKTRIDELPQLWNILKGELSFIGPRPELPAIARIYEQEIPYYEVRHLITPGLSGWAQIYDYDAPRGGADVERTRRKLSYDLYYLKHRSLGLDMAIALKTLRALLSFSGT